MKTKRLKKKLSLNKQTITHLNDDEMKGIYGGTMWDTCCIGCTTIFACEEDTSNDC